MRRKRLLLKLSPFQTTLQQQLPAHLDSMWVTTMMQICSKVRKKCTYQQLGLVFLLSFQVCFIISCVTVQYLQFVLLQTGTPLYLPGNYWPDLLFLMCWMLIFFHKIVTGAHDWALFVDNGHQHSTSLSLDGDLFWSLKWSSLYHIVATLHLIWAALPWNEHHSRAI